MHTHRGPGGGSSLARPAGSITVGEILRAVDGPLAAVRDRPPDELVYEGAARNLPAVWCLVQATLHEVSSTADAARLVQTDPHAAAVASREAAVRYGLRVLFSNIEDHPENETRFAVIALSDSARTGDDKTAILFQVPHTPGSLADVLQVFA